MTRPAYRHAIWPPSPKWPDGFMLSAPVADFKRLLPEKVAELGAPLRVWDSHPHAHEETGDEAAA